MAPAQQGKVVQKPALMQSNMNVTQASSLANHLVDNAVDQFIKVKDSFDAIGSKIQSTSTAMIAKQNAPVVNLTKPEPQSTSQAIKNNTELGSIVSKLSTAAAPKNTTSATVQVPAPVAKKEDVVKKSIELAKEAKQKKEHPFTSLFGNIQQEAGTVYNKIATKVDLPKPEPKPQSEFDKTVESLANSIIQGATGTESSYSNGMDQKLRSMFSTIEETSKALISSLNTVEASSSSKDLYQKQSEELQKFLEKERTSHQDQKNATVKSFAVPPGISTTPPIKHDDKALEKA